MWRRFMSLGLVLAIVLGAVFMMSGNASAGTHKRINAAGLGAGGQISVHASPLNQGAAMEMDTYEFLTAAAGGTYRCRITSNGTGRSLNLRLIGVNATIINQCTTAINGPCDTPFVGLVGNLLFQCIVATQNGAPVGGGAHYVFAVQRQ